MEDNKDKDFEKEELNEVEESGLRVQSGDGFRVIPLKGLIDNWFIDYASSVILDRAVPEINDGLFYFIKFFFFKILIFIVFHKTRSLSYKITKKSSFPES